MAASEDAGEGHLTPRRRYDLSGDGRRVIRGGCGLYFDQYNVSASAGDITSQNYRPLNALATLTNTSYGVGQLATYASASIRCRRSRPRNSAAQFGGQWVDPNITDPRTHQAHIGYAHTLAPTRCCRSTTRASKDGKSCGS
jgi:hypothetical protein